VVGIAISNLKKGVDKVVDPLVDCAEVHEYLPQPIRRQVADLLSDPRVTTLANSRLLLTCSRTDSLSSGSMTAHIFTTNRKSLSNQVLAIVPGGRSMCTSASFTCCWMRALKSSRFCVAPSFLASSEDKRSPSGFQTDGCCANAMMRGRPWPLQRGH
jgi:hypothetical protein